MAGWEGWLALVGGIIAVIGQFWGGGVGGDANYWLPAIGGALAVIAGIGSMMK